MSYVSIKKKKEDTTTKCHVRSWIRFCNNKVTFKKRKHMVLRKKTSIKSITQYQLYNSKIKGRHTQKHVF